MGRAILAAVTAVLAGQMTVAVSTHGHDARDVRYALTFRYDMQCGYPGKDPAVVTFPGRVPLRIARTAVLVDGAPARDVTVRGRAVTVAMPPRPLVMCASIGPGRLTIVFTPRAGIANPAVPGGYAVRVVKGTQTFAAPVAVR